MSKSRSIPVHLPSPRQGLRKEQGAQSVRRDDGSGLALGHDLTNNTSEDCDQERQMDALLRTKASLHSDELARIGGLHLHKREKNYIALRYVQVEVL